MTCSVVAGLSPSGGSLGALMKARTFSRAPSYNSSISSESVWMPRWTLA